MKLRWKVGDVLEYQETKGMRGVGRIIITGIVKGQYMWRYKGCYEDQVCTDSSFINDYYHLDMRVIEKKIKRMIRGDL